LVILLILIFLWVMVGRSGPALGFDSEVTSVEITVKETENVMPGDLGDDVGGTVEGEEGDISVGAFAPDASVVIDRTCSVSAPFVDVEARGFWPWQWCTNGPCQVSWTLNNTGGGDLVARITPKSKKEQGECFKSKLVNVCPDDTRGNGVRQRFGKGAPAIGPIPQGTAVSKRPLRAGPWFKDEAPRDNSPDTQNYQQYTWWYNVEVSTALIVGGKKVFDPANIVCEIDPRVCIRKNGVLVCQNI
jgi:hypothetical protein